MNISATGCTPIKPQASFGQQKDPSLETVVSKTDKINQSLVNSNDLKGPLAVVASVALAAVVTYTSGRKVADVISSLTGKKAGTAVMGALDKGSKAIAGGAEKLVSNELKGKSGKAVKTLGNVLKTTNETVSKNFKRFAYMGTSGIEDAATKNAKALSNLVGAGTVVGMLPSLCKRDGDGNNVADIAEKGQNVYTGTAYERSKRIAEESVQKLGVVADLVQTLM